MWPANISNGSFSRFLAKGKSPKSWRWYALVAALSLTTSVAVGFFIPAHIPRVHDEFAYLLAGQTFTHFELTNPTHPLWRFFETPHVLMQPSYMAKYPPGHGLMLAVGYWLGHPIFGVWLESALFAVSVAWLIRGFFAPRWAFIGGLLAIAQFGLTYYWNQTYWGGALAAVGGALVFGGAWRIWRRQRGRDALLLGLGVVILMLTRPFEGLLACIVPAALVFTRWFRDSRVSSRQPFIRVVLPGALIIASGFSFLAYYNYRVTGHPTRLPYLEYERQYAGTPYFVWQTTQPEPRFLNAAFRDYYRDYMVPLSRFYGTPLRVWGERLWLTARNFLGPFLTFVALLGLILQPRGKVSVAAASLAVCALAMILSYWFSSHYQAGAAPLYLFLAVAGLRRVSFALPRRAHGFKVVCALLALVQGTLLWRDASIERDIRVYTSPSRRQKIIDTLVAAGGRHLVLVHPEKSFPIHDSWVCNDARIDESPVVWAWDRGPEDNRHLLAYYPERRVVLMTAGAEGIFFTAYPRASPGP